MNPKRLHNATLIQNGWEWYSYFEPELSQAISLAGLTQPINIEECVTWIAREQIEKIFGMIVIDHHPDMSPFALIYGKLKNIIPIQMDALFTHYLRVPKLYGDSPVVVHFKGTDLVIEYYLENLKPYIETLQ